MFSSWHWTRCGTFLLTDGKHFGFPLATPWSPEIPDLQRSLLWSVVMVFLAVVPITRKKNKKNSISEENQRSRSLSDTCTNKKLLLNIHGSSWNTSAVVFVFLDHKLCIGCAVSPSLCCPNGFDVFVFSSFFTLWHASDVNVELFCPASFTGLPTCYI